MFGGDSVRKEKREEREEGRGKRAPGSKGISRWKPNE
jgi:hypothetical protein